MFLPAETKVEWKVFLHGKTLATLTLTRRQEHVVWDGEVVEGVEHVLDVRYQPVRKTVMQLATMGNVYREGKATIHIPDACWTEAGALRLEGGESVVEKWTHGKAAFLERWVLEKHGRITRDWRVTRQDPVYYWG